MVTNHPCLCESWTFNNNWFQCSIEVWQLGHALRWQKTQTIGSCHHRIQVGINNVSNQRSATWDWFFKFVFMFQGTSQDPTWWCQNSNYHQTSQSFHVTLLKTIFKRLRLSKILSPLISSERLHNKRTSPVSGVFRGLWSGEVLKDFCEGSSGTLLKTGFCWHFPDLPAPFGLSSHCTPFGSPVLHLAWVLTSVVYISAFI